VHIVLYARELAADIDIFKTQSGYAHRIL
jgi:hypothetical protein